MTGDRFREMALALDGVIESAHMGHPDFRAFGRIFATLKEEPATFGVVMLTPQQQQQILERSGAFTPESGAWGRSGCTRVHLPDTDEETLGEVLTMAWQNAAARAPGKAVRAPGKAVAKTAAQARRRRPLETARRAGSGKKVVSDE
jgi:hypothetical protein